MDIYQQIWDADQAANGIQPILADWQGDAARGYVKVATTAMEDEDVRILTDLVIPDKKKADL
ncbi:hypothetical protein [Endobacterium cereale]|uniref:hypothetical protein n=1 Tax=Endobacterium cereale TaxID=2663029 RepID=UPI002B497B8B|nr:hypothetical protein [Endobacterium cereale]MEB2842997.1 hypothetical protein [Endobacterium cereale]